MASSQSWRVLVRRGGRSAPVKLSAGFAPLADGSCVASRGGTVVAASAVWTARCPESSGGAFDGGGGVPLSVEFRHGSAASGLLPGHASLRDGARMGDAEVLAARAVDRSLRPRSGQHTGDFKGSYLGRFPLGLAEFWTSDHLSEWSRSMDVGV